MKLKVCGMKFEDNIRDVASLQPDYLGFIFHEKSPRHFENRIPQLTDDIKKVGVFVDEPVEFIVSQVKKHDLDAVQLHGHESPEVCQLLKSLDVEVIKVFSIKDEFDFSILDPYDEVCDYYLFDTKGKLPGGNGYAFNWNVLNHYNSSKPFFLSGGIGLEQIENLRHFMKSSVAQHCHAIDVNSRFEIEPGLKDKTALERFKDEL